MKDADKEEYVLNDRFKNIYEVLKSKYKVKEIIEKLKFSGSRQLYNIIEDKNLVSTRAIDALIKNFNVNPTFIFTGEGSMFIDENQEGSEDLEFYRNSKAEADHVILSLHNEVKRLEERIEQKEQAFNTVVENYRRRLEKYEGEEGENVSLSEQKRNLEVEEIRKKYSDK